MDDPTTLSYSSSNERVVRVSNEEKMRFVDYGVAVVTAAYNDISTSMLVTVTPNEYNKVGFENTDEYGSSQTVSAEYKRNGEKALMVAGMVTTFRDWNQSGGPEVKAAKTTHYTLYLDGQQVMDSDSTTIERFIVTAQAGQFETNTAWFDDAVQNRYLSIENLNITETDNGAYSADFDYYGISKDAAVEYKWYASDTEDGEYSLIANENEKTFTPDSQTTGKFIKASVKVTDTLDGNTVTTNERFSESVLAGGTFMEYLANGKLLITADKNIGNAAAVIAVYEQSGEFQKLVSARVVDSISVSKGNSKTVTIGNISKTDTQTAKIMLWDSIMTQKALCNAVTVE